MKKIFILMLLTFSTSIYAQEFPRFIDVNGTAEVITQADYISFSVIIRNVAETLEESKQINVNASNELVNILNDFKISKGEWELSPIKFGKEYSYSNNEQKQVGYYAQVNAAIKLKNMGDYFSFINALSKNKFYEISNSFYGVTDLLKYHKEATINAVQAAREKAEYIAKSMNVKLGKIIQIKELNQFETFPNPQNVVKNFDGGNQYEDVSGKISITRSVNLKIEIID
jgi:uncharacterized protein YggE